MNNYKHLKKKKLIVQFSDGSSSSLTFYINKKELLAESDIKSNIAWKAKLDCLEVDNKKTNSSYNYDKLFAKIKKDLRVNNLMVEFFTHNEIVVGSIPT